MIERRKHKRLPVIGDLAEPVEVAVMDKFGKIQQIPAVLTNLSAGGMDLILMSSIEGQPQLKLSIQIAGLDRFEVEGRVVWTRTKGPTEILGVSFTKIGKRHADQITHMAEVYHETLREKKKAANLS